MEGEMTYYRKMQHEVLSKVPQFVSYVDQKDIHYPTLTAKETLEFAHDCTGEVSPQVMNKNQLDTVIRQLGLETCQDTIIGDSMLRGLSGGERKRVTTGEMAFGNKFVLMMDEISTGLDSAATFDIVSTQRHMAKSFGKTVVISLLQPSPEVYALFDDVILLNDGYVMYHGPRADALGYFEDLGFTCPLNRDVADFFMELGTSKQLQYEVNGAPRQASEFATCFQHSVTHSQIEDALCSPLDPLLSENMMENVSN